MLILVAAAVGVAALLVLSLVLKLRSIRRRGFGEGSRLELPEAELEMRHPHWWKPARETASTPGRTVVVLKTGHSRGVLRIAAWRQAASPELAGPEALADSLAEPLADSLRAELAAVLREQGLELDDPEITAAPVLPVPPVPSEGTTGGVPGMRVWVASGGRQGSRPDERTYFEVHLLALGGARVLFSYTNSVLQGFLDAYYLEKVLKTVQPARFPR